jgi:GNAT superfamily N-acetyltransferase
VESRRRGPFAIVARRVSGPHPEVAIEEGARLGAAEYRGLRADAGWSAPAAADPALQRALDASWNVTARTGAGELVGMGRLLDDGALYASIWDMIVRTDHRGHGVGGTIFAALMRRAGDRDLVALVATPLGAPMYRRAGFAESSRGSTALLWRRP